MGIRYYEKASFIFGSGLRAYSLLLSTVDEEAIDE
jgi:hypothetical protein